MNLYCKTEKHIVCINSNRLLVLLPFKYVFYCYIKISTKMTKLFMQIFYKYVLTNLTRIKSILTPQNCFLFN